MSTNAVISVPGVKVSLYKHWDGYPDATLAWLKKFNEEFTKERGKDPEYKFAQLIRSSAFMQEEFNLDPSTYTGWGVIPYRKAEYNYLLEDDGAVSIGYIKESEQSSKGL